MEFVGLSFKSFCMSRFHIIEQNERVELLIFWELCKYSDFYYCNCTNIVLPGFQSLQQCGKQINFLTFWVTIFKGLVKKRQILHLSVTNKRDGSLKKLFHNKTR